MKIDLILFQHTHQTPEKPSVLAFLAECLGDKQIEVVWFPEISPENKHAESEEMYFTPAALSTAHFGHSDKFPTHRSKDTFYSTYSRSRPIAFVPQLI